uniref:Kinesin-like protein n=1 Tax=Syphacia muris TaxID=451379 RepID=A0A0N5A913_9BILA
MQRRHIHVAARVRPCLTNNGERNSEKVVKAVSDSVIRITGGNYFIFDSAFEDDKNQADVFNLVAKDIVKGCIEGYNGTVFAYGQTGSGKTYTMIGPGLLAETLKQCPEKSGLIPRVAELIFFLLREKQKKEEAFMFEVKTTFVQLYKEKLYDLLGSDSDVKNLQIRLDDHGNTVLTGAEERVVNTISDLILVVDEGLARRKVAETAMNTESSRSHAILTFTIKTTVCGNNGITVNKCSRLNLVDLAGSERQKDALSAGERLKEASSINLSLLMLGRVIRALSEPDFKHGSYIAYRDSTLTLLLKDSLGGNAQTAVIVTVHPNKRFLDETILTLRFAQQVKKVKNHAIVNEDLTGESVDAFKAEIRRLNLELSEAKSKFPNKALRKKLSWLFLKKLFD